MTESKKYTLIVSPEELQLIREGLKSIYNQLLMCRSTDLSEELFDEINTEIETAETLLERTLMKGGN